MSKRWKAFGIIQTATALAAAAAGGMAQIPFSDVPVLCSIETSMVIALGALYGVRLDESAAKGILAAYVSTTVGGSTFKAIFGVCPGVGNGVNAAIASGTIELIGWSVYSDFKNNPEKFLAT
jgi:uncharacterized protein (DUF697 family)